jgi:hypothetical protein
MKCYYCHHRKGKCFLSFDRTVVILCEYCADRNMTIRNLSGKFGRPDASYAQHPKDALKIGKVGKGSDQAN